MVPSLASQARDCEEGLQQIVPRGINEMSLGTGDTAKIECRNVHIGSTVGTNTFTRMDCENEPCRFKTEFLDAKGDHGCKRYHCRNHRILDHDRQGFGMGRRVGTVDQRGEWGMHQHVGFIDATHTQTFSE